MLIPHFHDAPALPQGALNPQLDARAIQADYFRNGPGMRYIDDFLRPEALASLRTFCVESDFAHATALRYTPTPSRLMGYAAREGLSCSALAK